MSDDIRQQVSFKIPVITPEHLAAMQHIQDLRIPTRAPLEQSIPISELTVEEIDQVSASLSALPDDHRLVELRFLIRDLCNAIRKAQGLSGLLLMFQESLETVAKMLPVLEAVRRTDDKPTRKNRQN